MAPAPRARVPGPEGQGPYSVMLEWLYRVPATGLVKPIFSGTMWFFTILLTVRVPSLDREVWQSVDAVLGSLLMPHRPLGSHSRGWGGGNLNPEVRKH